jgi:hypothetical protein
LSYFTWKSAFTKGQLQRQPGDELEDIRAFWDGGDFMTLSTVAEFVNYNAADFARSEPVSRYDPCRHLEEEVRRRLPELCGPGREEREAVIRRVAESLFELAETFKVSTGGRR